MISNAEFNKKATRGFAWNYLYKLSEFGLTNLYTIIVVRKFGPEVSAPYAVFSALATTLSILAAFAVDGVLLRYIQRISVHPSGDAEHFGEIESLSLPNFLSTLLAFRFLIVGLISSLVAFVFLGVPSFIPSVGESFGLLKTFTPHLIIFLFAQSLSAFSTFSLTGLLETKRVFFVSFVSRITLLLLGVWLVYAGNLTLDTSITVFVTSAVLSGLLMYIMLRVEVRKQTRSSEHTAHQFTFWHSLATLWKFISSRKHLTFFLSTPLLFYGITTWGNDMLSTVLGRQPDILMMRAMLGEKTTEIGYYFSASQIILVTEYVFLFGLGGTLVSIFSKLAHDDEKNKKGKYLSLAKARREIAGFQTVVLVPLCCFIFFYIRPIIHSVYGEAYLPAATLVQVGLVAMLISVAAFGGGMQVTSLVSIGKERLVFRNRLTWGLINVIGNFVLIYYFGALGAVIGTHYCNAGACASESYFASKYIGKSINYASTMRIFLISVIAAAVSYEIFQLVGTSISSWFVVIGSGSIDAILVIILYKTFKVPELRILTSRLQSLFPSLVKQ